MSVASLCPDASMLQRFAVGQMPPAEVEKLAQHCEQCPRCIQVLHTLKADDTLIAAMAAQGTAPDQSRNVTVNALIERLKQMPSPVPAPELSATIGAESTPLQSIESTQAGDISLAPPQAADEIGRLGGYRVLKMLGAGGMGMVYQAEDVHLQRPIALKVMKAEVAKNPGNRERFLREARAAAKLKSDHVVNVYQVGEDNQVVFLAMEFLEGMSLDDWLKKGRKPTLAQTVRIGRQIALGLADAHGCGLIHRDIKPGNIWLDSRHQGRAKLLDFGLARGTSEEVHLTQSGAIVGTPAYMAPEQARGEKVDHRVDLFSLGVVLYRLTTGQLPFRGDNTMSILTALALDNPKPPREVNADIPPRMASLIERLLSKDREQRPATAKAVADELAQIEREATPTLVGAASVSAPVVPTVSLRSRLIPRLRYGLRKYVVAASLLLLLGGIAAAIVIIVRDPQGNKIAEINVPKGSKIEIQDADAKANVPPKEEAKIVAPPLAPMQPGEPLSPIALVQQPAKLPGVRSWSIETRAAATATRAAYRPDGKRLAVASLDGSIRIWEPDSGRLVQVLLGQGNIGTLAWSPDGRVLAAGTFGSNQPIRLWEAETGRFLRTLESTSTPDYGVLAWSPDGRKLLTGQRGEYFVWDATNGKLMHKWPAPDADVQAFSSDGKYAAGRDLVKGDVVFIWDVATGKEVRQLTGSHGQGGGAPVNWSPDGKHLGCGAQNGVFVWEAATGKKILQRKDIVAHAVIWSPDGRMWAVVPINNNWRRLVEISEGALGQSFLECDLWSPDGKTAVGSDPYFGVIHLYDAMGKRLRTLSEGSALSSYAWLPHGPFVAVTGYDRTAALASVDNGHVSTVLKDVTGPIVWSPDGKTLATRGVTGNLIALWDSSGKLRHTMAAHPPGVDWLAWSPDGKRLASSSEGEKRVLLWDAEKGERLRELGPFAERAESVTWSPDGRLVAFNVANVGWHIWDVDQNKLANDPKHWNMVEIFQFTPDSRSAVVNLGGWKPNRLRELTTGKDSRELPWALGSWSWSPDERLLARPVGATVELWRGDLSRRVRTLHATQQIEQVAFSADGKLVAGRSGQRLHLWEADTGRLRGILLLGEKNNGLTLAPDGQYTGNEKVERGIVMVVQKDDGTQELLEPADFEQKYGWKNDPDKVHLLKPLPPPLYPLPGMPMGPQALVREPAELPDVNSWTIETLNARGQVKAIAYRPDGKLLATGGDDGTIRIWDTANGNLVRMLVGDQVVSLSWSNDGKILAAGSGRNNGETALWDADASRLLRRIPFGALVAWSPNGRTLALRVGDTVQLWDDATEQITRTYRFPGYGSVPVWSPDGKTLAVGISDKTIRLWDAASGKETRKLEGHEGVVVGVAWSPDGKRLVSIARGERAFHVWDAVNGKRLGRFAVENAWDMEAVVAWSPDGKAVALGFNHNQGPHGLFDAATGQPIRSLDGGRYVSALAFSADGKQMATAGSDGVRLHDTASGKRMHTLEEGNGDVILTLLGWSPDSRLLALRDKDGRNSQVVEAATGRQRPSVAADDWQAAARSPNGHIKAILEGKAVHLYEASGFPLGVLLPFDVFGHLAVTSDGRYRGNARVERAIRMVVQKRDGTSETLTPREFERKYSFKNEPDKVRLIDK